jgi:hemoglobin
VGRRGTATGGPFAFTGRDMHDARQHLHITADEFGAVGAEIARALEYYQVPERERQEVLAAIAAHMTAVDDPSPSAVNA